MTPTDPLTRIAAKLDERIWQRPFVVIAADNEAVADRVTGRAVADNLDDARALAARLPDAASIVGNLRPGLVGLDVDPTGDGAHWRGDRIAEQLATWSEHHGLPWWVRESGRPGGRHLIIALPEHHLSELRDRVRELAAEHRCSIRIARALRLLTAPHRLGLPAPNVAGTLRPHHLPAHREHPHAATTQKPTTPRKHRAGARPERRTAPTPSFPGAAHAQPGTLASGEALDTSPSGATFGRACWSARSGASKDTAWATALRAPALAQVTRRGRDHWERFMWLPAITTIAAEQGIDEDEAWARARAAHPRRCRDLGRSGWRVQLWEPALAQAQTDRPRRFTDPDAPARPRPDEQQRAEIAAEIETARAGLRAAGQQWVDDHGRRPQVRTTLGAVLDALAEVIVRERGRIGQRRLAEHARVSDSTLWLRLNDAITAGIVRIVASYRKDGQRCNVYGIGPTGQAAIQTVRQTQGRSCTPPTNRPTGSANTSQAQARHEAQRQAWRSDRKMDSTETENIEKAYPGGDHPARAVIRSRMHQIRWWKSLSRQEQEQRRTARRKQLDDMAADERQLWLDWLARRDMIDDSIQHLLNGTAVALDHRIIAGAPMILHHGRRDPAWHTGGTPRAATARHAHRPLQGQLEFSASPRRSTPRADASP